MNNIILFCLLFVNKIEWMQSLQNTKVSKNHMNVLYEEIDCKYIFA